MVEYHKTNSTQHLEESKTGQDTLKWGEGN